MVMLCAVSLLSFCFLGQLSAASLSAETPSADAAGVIAPPASLPEGAPSRGDAIWHSPASEPDVARVAKAPEAKRAAEALRQMIAKQTPADVSGESLTLLAAVGASSDPRQQQQIIHTYWRLVEAAVVRQVREESSAFLRELTLGGERSPALQAALAAAVAKEKDAAAAMTGIQYELAALLGRAADAPLPWPSDVPHVGEYHTRFAESFRGRPAPPLAAQLDRTLPVEREAIDRRAAAMEECDKALQAAVADWRAKQASLGDLLAAARETGRQREAFLSAVLRYNVNIADYAFATVAPASRPETIVGMLIKPPYELTPPAANIAVDPAVRPATFSEAAPAARPRRGMGPTPANPLTRPAIEGDLPLGLRSAKGAPQQTPISAPTGRQSMRVNKPTVQEAPAANAGGSFHDPVEKQPAKTLGPADAALAREVARLTDPTAWAEAEGVPVTFAAALAAARGDRRAAVEAYWMASRRATECALLAQHARKIKSLKCPDGTPYQRQRLTASVAISEAAAIEWKAVWLEAQGQLAARLGRENETLWPIPATPMSCVTIEPPSRFGVALAADLWRLKRLAASIADLEGAAALHARALERAATVRSEAFAAAKGESVGAALQSAALETEEALAVVDSVTTRNLAMAELAFALLPANASNEALAAALAPQL